MERQTEGSRDGQNYDINSMCLTRHTKNEVSEHVGFNVPLDTYFGDDFYRPDDQTTVSKH